MKFGEGIKSEVIGNQKSDVYTIKVEYPIKYVSMCMIGGNMYCGIRLANAEEQYFLEKVFGEPLQGAVWTNLQPVPDG